MTQKILILIPARFKSSRFPGKPLYPLLGKTLVDWVYDHFAHFAEDYFKILGEKIEAKTFVVTDDERIEMHLRLQQRNVLRVDDDVPSGTERIAIAYDRFLKTENADLILNVQGDEPLLMASDVVDLIQKHLSSQTEMGTLARPMDGMGEEFYDPNKVKVVFSQVNHQALYFSRAPIPYLRDKNSENILDFKWYHHIGVYSFKPDALEKLSHMPLSKLENLEKLEQLRALEAGMKIVVGITHKALQGVDHLHDIKAVEDLLKN